MKKRLSIIIVGIAFANVLFAQVDSTSRRKTNAVFFAPLNFFDVINPSFQIGYERTLSDKISAQIEGGVILRHSVFGFIFESLGREDYWYTNSGYKLRFEIKYSIRDRVRFPKNPYLSLEIFCTKNNSHVNNLFIVKDTTFIYPIPRPAGYNAYEDFFTIDKLRLGFNVKIGTRILLSKHLFIEPHIGLGIVFRKSQHYGRMNINDDTYDKVLSFHNEKGDALIPNLPWNVKFGYRF